MLASQNIFYKMKQMWNTDLLYIYVLYSLKLSMVSLAENFLILSSGNPTYWLWENGGS